MPWFHYLLPKTGEGKWTLQLKQIDARDQQLQKKGDFIAFEYVITSKLVFNYDV